MGRVLLVALVAVVMASGDIASADDPRSALHAAVDKTGSAKTAHLSLKQTTKAADRSLETRVSGTLARGDQDLVTAGDAGDSRRVAVGHDVYERRPNTNDSPWLFSSRPAPTTDAAFGALTLRDGTSLGDPRLFRSVTDVGIETLPTGDARKIVADLDMSAVATAMQLSGPDAARLARMTGTMTIWITPSDGRIARHVLTLVLPTTTGTTTIESTIDLSDLDAPLVITRP